MTTTYFLVEFSLLEVSINKSFCQDGSELKLHEWSSLPSGRCFYYAETRTEAVEALTAKIEQTREFLLQAEQKYEA